MFVPTLYVCRQVEQARRQDEQRAARLWRMLRDESMRGRSRKTIIQRPSLSARRVWKLLSSPGL